MRVKHNVCGAQHGMFTLTFHLNHTPVALIISMCFFVCVCVSSACASCMFWVYSNPKKVGPPHTYTQQLYKEAMKKIPHTIVKQVMRNMGITHVADTPVGDDLIRGVSGGQKKRVTFGEVRCCQLLFNSLTLTLNPQSFDPIPNHYPLTPTLYPLTLNAASCSFQCDGLIVDCHPGHDYNVKRTVLLSKVWWPPTQTPNSKPYL